MARYLGTPKVQYFKTGTVDYLVGGKAYFYNPESMVLRNTYPTVADALAGTNANTNPVILDSRGEASIVINGNTKMILKDASGNTIWTEDNIDQATSDIFDANGNELLKFVSVASAVNEWTITNAATTFAPIFSTSGGDTNVEGKITSKGSGILKLDGGATGSVDINTTSTGPINLKRNTAVTGTLSVSALLTASAGITVPSGQATNFLPAGTVAWKASTNVPTGWLECDGSAISRTTYSALFTDIGIVYGAGDASTTFNLPTSARVTLVGKGGSGTATLANTVGATGGSETHTLTTAEMPAHTHSYNTFATSNVLTVGGATSPYTSNGATSGSTGGGGAHNNMQPSLVMMMIIRAF